MDAVRKDAVIFLTLRCTLKCPLCASLTHTAGYTVPSFIDIETFVRQCQARHIYKITISGGEPTIEAKLLRRAVDCIHRYDMKAHIYSNGYPVRDIGVYGNADKIVLTNYGAQNADFLWRLKKQGGHRIRIKWGAHARMRVPRQPDTLPAKCCHVQYVLLGSRVYGCCIQATDGTGLSVSVNDNWDTLSNPRVCGTCSGCVGNQKVKSDTPSAALEWGIWGTSIGGMVTIPISIRSMWSRVMQWRKTSV